MEPTGRTEATDAVERGMVARHETVRLRDKHIARTGAMLMIPGALVFLLATIGVAMGADPAAPRVAAIVPLLAFAAMVYTAVANTVVRTAVTDRAVRVQWGLRRLDIPLASIARVGAELRTGGVSAGIGAGWSIFADRGAVHLSWTEGAETRNAIVPAHDPSALAAAIVAAQQGTTGVRMEATSEANDEAADAAGNAATTTRARR